MRTSIRGGFLWLINIITVDFGAAYSATFSRNRYYGTRLVDYERLPARFGTYSPDDQQRIKDRMKALTKTLD